jgi:hypothetical protein
MSRLILLLLSAVSLPASAVASSPDVGEPTGDVARQQKISLIGMNKTEVERAELFIYPKSRMAVLYQNGVTIWVQSVNRP